MAAIAAIQTAYNPTIKEPCLHYRNDGSFAFQLFFQDAPPSLQSANLA
jgi:hypothetical protein